MSEEIPNLSKTESEKYEKAEMVGWYDPKQLFNTGVMTAISTTIGEYADPRVAATAPRSKLPFNYTKHLILTEDEEVIQNELENREDIWIDYVADMGDGWNSTYGIAYYLAKQKLKIGKHETKRGEIIIFGGDAVYPTANTANYEKKLVTPYRMAFRAAGGIESEPPKSPRKLTLSDEPHIFALPGNHDWYDSLVAFRKLFCSHIFNDRRFACFKEKGEAEEIPPRGGWRTRQKRSYWALKLPQNWWLLGVDMQLSHNIDVTQLEYFESIIEQMKAGDKVILCVPEPYWMKAIKYENMTDKFEEKEASIEKLESYFLKHEIQVKAYIAGDLHHYRRFRDKRGVHKITAGGGGAFLHPTHDFDFKKNEKKRREKRHKTETDIKHENFILKKEYPEFAVSKRMDKKNLLFLFTNFKFGAVTAFIYAILAWLVHGRIDGNFSVLNAITATLHRVLGEQPLALLLIIVLLAALIFFTDSNNKWYKRIAGFMHGVAHLTAISILGWLGYFIALNILGATTIAPEPDLYSGAVWFLSVVCTCFVGGWIIGSIIMGHYLYISLHWFHRHDNEAFSALKIEDYKNFLRLHIDKKGDLTIYSAKIETVPKDWQDVLDEAAREIKYREPKGEHSVPELIEKIVITEKEQAAEAHLV
jgi:hypothetical protein